VTAKCRKNTTRKTLQKENTLKQSKREQRQDCVQHTCLMTVIIMVSGNTVHNTRPPSRRADNKNKSSRMVESARCWLVGSFVAGCSRREGMHKNGVRKKNDLRRVLKTTIAAEHHNPFCCCCCCCCFSQSVVSSRHEGERTREKIQ